jgi:autotransporter-associated beta strand protein
MWMLSRANIARLFVAALVVTTVHGQTWNGAGANDNWSTGGASGNWTGAAAPVSNGTANVAFGGSTRLTPFMDNNWNINSLVFNSGAGAFTLGEISGDALIVESGGITNNSLNTETINTIVVAAVAQTWTASSGALSFGNLLSGNALSFLGTVTIDGSFSTGIHAGIVNVGGLTKNGTGTLLLDSGAGNSSYTGLTTINTGTVSVTKLANAGSNSSLGAPTGSNATILLGSATAATLSYTGGTDSTDRAITINGAGGGTIQATAAGTLTLTGGINNSGNPLSFDTNTGNITETGLISGGGGLTKTGTGTLTLPGANTFSGTLFLNAGTLAVGNNAAAGTGTLALSGGAIQAVTSPQTLANTVSILADTTFAGSLGLTFSGPVTVTGARTLTVNNAATTTFSGTVNLAGGNSLTEVGTGALTFSQPNTLAGAFNLNAGTFNAPNNVTFSSTGTFTQNAGTTFTGGTLINQGSFVYNGGTFSGQLNNQGSSTFNADFTASDGLVNSANMTVASGRTLTLNGAGLDNEGGLALSGTLAGNGALVNNSSITGSGSIAGSGGFTNNGTLTASAGNFTLSNSGTNTNNGTITLPNGFQFRVTGTTLNNSGTINLNSATLAGTGTLANLAAGVVDGPGTISAATFTNSGIVQPGKGTLNILSAWTNNGALQLTDFTSNVTGGTITNAGQIQGQGSIGAPVINNATIAPSSGGTLNIGGTLQNNASGLVRVSSGNTLAALSGLVTNAGIINLTGGTFDNNAHALNNTGQVSGYGTLSTGGLTNNGSVTFTGGTTTVNGDVTNASGKTVRILYNPAIFTGNVTNNGTFKTTSTTATFAGTFTNNGTFSSDPATQYFQDLKIGATGALQGGVGDLFVINGNLTNNSTQNSLFNISGGQITLASGAHTMAWAGANLGASAAGFTNNFGIGTFELNSGNTLTLTGGTLYVHAFELGGGLSQISSITGNGSNIYYDVNNPANAYLNDGTYSLQGGGVLAPVNVVPEPGTIALLFAGTMASWITLRRRHRKM